MTRMPLLSVVLYIATRLALDGQVVAMLVGCLHGTTDWSLAVSWHRVRVDFGAANGNA